MEGVAYAAVGAELLENGDVHWWCHGAHSSRRIGFRRMRSGIAEPAEAQHLRADENQVTVDQLRGLVDKDPAAIPRAQIAEPERSVVQLYAGVHGGQVDVSSELDVGIAAADDGLVAIEDEDLGRLAAFVEDCD